jgi:hypothetical protein
MNREELQEWILRRLGAPMWNIELCEEHIKDAIETAVRWFAAKKGVMQTFSVNVVSSQTEYELDCKIDKVIDVYPELKKLDLSLVFSPFTLLEEKIPYDVFASGASGGLYSSYVQSLQYIDMAKRILSADFTWWQINRTLYISPSPVESQTMIILAKTNFTDIEELDERDHDLLKRYALAQAKIDLGWARSKYSEYPSAQGSVSLNWDRLIDDAKEEIEKLEEEIIGAGYPMGMIVG